MVQLTGIPFIRHYETGLLAAGTSRIIFYGSDEELFNLEDPYIRDFLLVE